MKHKFLTLILLGAMASTTFFSCQNSEEPIQINNSYSEKDVEYSISVNVPDEMRTRSGQIGEVGEDGLIAFPSRKIDRLYYGVYINEEKSSTGSVDRTGTQPFTIIYKAPEGIEKDQISFFFWAGSSSDFTNSDPVFKIDYEKKTVSITELNYYPANTTKLYAFDSFTGYFKLSSLIKDESKSVSVTLKRPFSEIHLLTDDLNEKESNIYRDYSVYTVLSGFGKDKVNLENYKNEITIPTVWHFDTNELEFKGTTRNLLKNSLNGSYTTTFKGKQMNYLACFYTFGYIGETDIEDKPSKLNLGISYGNTFDSSKGQFVSIDLPESGIKSNYKYIIYNKSRSDGGTGFLEDPYYVFSINNDENWEEPDSENQVDKSK